MTKNEFIDELCRRLRRMPPDEAQKTVLFYSEAIDDRIEDGLGEEEAVAAMGSIDDIVREVMGTTPFNVEYERQSSGNSGSDEFKRREYTFSPDGVRFLQVSDTSCDVRFEMSRDGLIHVSCTEGRGVHYNITEGSTLSIKKVVETRFSFMGISLNLPFGISEGDLVISLPYMPDLYVSANTASGDIDVKIPELSHISAKTASGDLSIDRLRVSGPVEAATASGDAEINGVFCESLAVSTVSGDASLNDVTCGEAKITSVSGDAEIDGANISERLSVNTVSGNISCRLTEYCRKTEFESLSGNVEAAFPGNAADYSVFVKSAGGRCRVPEYSTGGPYSLRAKTASGNIRFNFEEV